MQPYSDAILQHIGNELLTIFAAHRAVGLKGKMCLFTHPAQETWRSSEGGVQFWFDESELPQALERIRGYYRNGALPNATLLLNPVVHSVGADGSLKAEGSGIIWGTSFILGVAKLQQDQLDASATSAGSLPNSNAARTTARVLRCRHSAKWPCLPIPMA